MQKTTVFLLIVVAILGLSKPVFAQETTATLTGQVIDPKGGDINGATIQVKHVPTGHVITITSNNKGLFTLPNLKPGGPYSITITYVGYEAQTLNDINLSLGNNPEIDITLKPAGQLTEVVVTSGAKKSGASGLALTRSQLNVLPTLGRSLSDFTRLTPQSNNNSFAGTNFRYNNVTLDGAVNNDAIGFSNSAGGVSGGGQAGTAGAGTRTNPYSIDVIQEVQVQLSPYDVKLGNFTGGSVNAVTKSGTNDFHGSIYGYGRNQSLVGKSVDGLKTSIGNDFYDFQTGATLSGPIMKNKLFFIANAEFTRRQEPTFYNAGDPGAAISVSDAQGIVDFMKATYGYDPGSYGAYKIKTSSDKFFGRVDYNIDNKNSLMIRGIYTHGYGNNLERSSTNFQFSSTDFIQHTKNLNLVAELKTRFSNTLNNQAIVSLINVHEYRSFPGQLSPFMDIGGGKIWLGTWREASIYNMKQRTLEITDNLTLTKGINKFTFGTHNEIYNLNYGFVNSWNGRWEYADLNSFYANKPSRIRGSYAYDDNKGNRDALYNDVPGSEYNVNLLSLYAQDDISFSKKFKLSPGLRFDYSFVGNQPYLDPALTATSDYVSNDPTYTHTSYSAFDNKWLGNVTVSPRLGFNYDVNGNQKFIVRGGTGIFVGRMPFAWMGYAYTLSGENFGAIDYKPSSGTVVPLAMDPSNLIDTLNAHGGSSATATHEVDIIDNNFKLPTIWRSNIATDIKFGKGYKLTLDAMYTKSLYDVQFKQINIKDTTTYYTSGPAETPVYIGGKVNSNFSNVYLLTNTTEGYRYNFTAQISKTTSGIKLGDKLLNWNWSVAYTYGMSKDISNGIRNSFSSNYEVNPAINPNDPQLAYSNFDLRHRIVGTTSFNLVWKNASVSSLTFFYSGQSGSPYTFVYSNGNSAFGNAATFSLPYIPASQSEINFADYTKSDGTVYTAAQQWTDLNSVIESDSYLKTRRGQYAERNGARTPWNHNLDMKLMHEFKFKGDTKGRSLQLSVDVFNVLNLINNDWGHISFVTNTNNYNVNLLKFVNDASGIAPGKSNYTPTFNFIAPPSTGHYYTTDPINSRWQAQVGVKYNF